MTTGYEPRTAWVQGKEFAHPSFGHEWQDEVCRLIREQEIDPDLILQNRSLRDDYEQWFRDPVGYVELTVGYCRAAEATAIAQAAAHTLAETGVESITWADEVPHLRRPLWREPSRAQRKALVQPFIGQRVKVERWFGRVAANGDRTYIGTVLTVATTTIGSSADLLILQTDEGNVWAISLAQIAHMEQL